MEIVRTRSALHLVLALSAAQRVVAGPAVGWETSDKLQNEMKRIAVSVRKRAVNESDLSDAIRSSSRGCSPRGPGLTRPLKDEATALETRLIEEALGACDRNQMQAARRLGLSRQGMIKKMKRYEIRP